jgi:protein TonB
VVTAEQLALRIHEAVQSHFHYPLLARRHGWEGEVLLMLRVESDGRFSAIRVLSSSGHRVLDRAAVEALDRLARLPDARGVPPPGMETELPVRYRLIDPA